jgi:hypothetical protein
MRRRSPSAVALVTAFSVLIIHRVPMSSCADHRGDSGRSASTRTGRSDRGGAARRHPCEVRRPAGSSAIRRPRSPTARLHGPTRRAALRLSPAAAQAPAHGRDERSITLTTPGIRSVSDPLRARPDRRPAAGTSAPKRQASRSRSAHRALPAAGDPFASFAVPTILGERRFAEMKRAANGEMSVTRSPRKPGRLECQRPAETRFVRSAGWSSSPTSPRDRGRARLRPIHGSDDAIVSGA